MPPVSKIAKLPEHVRKWLHAAIVERAYGDTAGITAQLNAMLKDAGMDETVGTTTVNKLAQKVRRANESLRASLEAARMLQEHAGAGDALGGATLDLVQNEVFQLTLKLRELDDDETSPAERAELIDRIALAASRISRSRVNQDRWAADVRHKAEAAAKQVQDMAAKGGVSERTAKRMYNIIMGIAEPGAGA